MKNIDIGYSRILCPVDFSEPGRKAFYTAVGYARAFQAELIILHVSERRLATAGFDEVEEESEAMTRLEAGLVRRLDELQADGRLTESDRERMTLEIAGGKPWAEVVRMSEDREVDLIVMATRGSTTLKNMVIGSQAERVVRRAPCHVLCVKPDGFVTALE
jgi:nucleotide-binding universal stress UspA family protein